ncbi:MAG: hypothetical protein P8178_02710 [Candidatus Thiodiazotropha sp.]
MRWLKRPRAARGRRRRILRSRFGAIALARSGLRGCSVGGLRRRQSIEDTGEVLRRLLEALDASGQGGAAHDEEQQQKGGAHGSVEQPGDHPGLPERQAEGEFLRQLEGKFVLRHLRQQVPATARTHGEQQHEQAEEARQAARPDRLLASGQDVLVGDGGAVQGLDQPIGLRHPAVDRFAFRFQLRQQTGIDLQLVELALQTVDVELALRHLLIGLRMIVAAGLGAVFQGHQAGHGLDRIAVGMGRGDLALGQVEGLDELLVLIADQLVDLVRHLLDAAGQGLVAGAGIRRRQTCAVVAGIVEKTLQPVTPAVAGGELQLRRTVGLVPADDLGQFIEIE